MELHFIDILIIIIYLIGTIYIGFWISKKASRSIDSYFLGGNTIPWYVLGVSNASGMFDIAGTMWLVYVMFVYGMKSAWIPWLWPVFNQIFLMIYLSIWLRRSNVLTGAEWIKTRFGTGKGSNLSHIIVVVFALVSVIGFLAYSFKGIGKFAEVFLPWDLTPNEYALIFMGITTLYVVKGGMYSVVFTEVLQFVIMTIASIAVGIIAMNLVAPETLESMVPEGWSDVFFSWKLNMDWSGLLEEANNKIAKDGYGLFGAVFMMMLFKGFFVSAAGPAPNFDMQRILAAKTPVEASKMSFIVNIVLNFPRYMLITGLTILGIVFFTDELNAMGPAIDFEQLLPMAMREFVPVGLLGILIAGLLAAFMSTFAATVNAAPAYIVNDVYKRYINPEAGSKKLVTLSYISSFLVVVIGICFGLVVDSIDEVLQWLTTGLWGGYTAANVFKWYWWRFNGYGYFYGMAVGIFSAITFPLLLQYTAWVPQGLGAFSEYLNFLTDPNTQPIFQFPLIFMFSIIGCLLGSLLTTPENEDVLKKFYKNVRPWGFWKPIDQKVKSEDQNFKSNKNFGRDMINIIVGIIWQTSLVLIAMFLVTRNFTSLGLAAIVVCITSIFLKLNWWDKMHKEEKLEMENLK
ncbi:Na+:solute symporter [Aquimarina sp. U1-2]|uniref:sodium:solute symporter family protein n=1 Tax=Aquimarina sp. U1-2 TaxID=2823141 RepID=UPI001AECF30C|nr:sodium:solute symporter family protein [Aquimarina sp. U1-2]MBP2832876.1 Na+:solute symporter [Aquimarina sp. U1-2]